MNENNKTKECPKCGKKKIAQFLFGMPAYSKLLQRDMNEGVVILGGCEVSPDAPEYKCQDCGHEWTDKR